MPAGVTVGNMSFDEGMRLFRSGDVPGACEQFHQAVEQDENNHKAWNALGICLSKTGEHEDADTCFENALMLDPGNSTYERNRERNDNKRPANWQVRPKQEAKSDPKPYMVPAPVEKPLSFYLLTAAKLLGGFLLFCFICVFIAAFVFGMSGGATAKTKERVSGVPIQPTQQVTTAPVVVSPPSVSLAEKNAAKKARDYLSVVHFSRLGLIRQLEDFEKFSHSDAVYGADNSGADWNEQAAGKAQDYLDIMPFSRDGLIKQLVEFEKFTPEQAEHGASAVGY